MNRNFADFEELFYFKDYIILLKAKKLDANKKNRFDIFQN